MDKVTLTKKQLAELKEFIDTRGFHDPVVIMEILDHFACKVEEKMTENPNLPFLDAMYEAHADFGRMGFWYIAAKAEKEQMHIGNKTYAKNFKSLIFNPIYLGLLALGGFAFYKLYILLQPFEWWIFVGADLLRWSYVLIYIIGLFIVVRRIPKVYKRNYMGTGTTNYLLHDRFSWLIFCLVIIVPGRPPGESSIVGYAVFCSVVFVYLCVHFITYYRTVSDMVNHYNAVHNAFSELSE